MFGFVANLPRSLDVSLEERASARNFPYFETGNPLKMNESDRAST